MSSYSFQVSIVSRAPRKGNPGNAVESAAYIARERLMDDRTGIVYDYTKKGGIEFKGIYAPKDAPKWMQDRETLWNAVEEREDDSTRADRAQVARKFIIAIPHELNERERLWLVKDFARELSRKGMVMDFAIHTPDEKGDQRNYHAHMMMTMREVTADGFGKKVREWNDRTNVPAWRERWAELGAKSLDRAGHPLEAERFRHAHLSLEMQKAPARARGDWEFLRDLDRVPTPHLGPNVLAMEGKGIRTEKGAAHRNIVEHNARKIGRVKPTTAEKILERAPVRLIGAALDTVSTAFESLLSPVLTPEQKALGERAQAERDFVGQEAERMRRDERDRGGRDR